MVDGNILPEVSVKDEEGHWEGINPEGFRAIKSELQKGHGVSASFMADQASPGDPITEDSYLNTETWAQYTHRDSSTNHVVCIVGWDDSYPKENFNEDYMPPGDGAWLVKNSWGSETDYVTLENGMNIGKGDWGIEDENGNHTGYFWLSYYDKSLGSCETMSFDTDLSELDGDFDVWAYDYMPAMVRLEMDTIVQDENVLKTANVFTNSADTDAHLYSVSTRTAMPDAEVSYSIYKLNENPENPEDGTLLETKTASYTYPGFHREKLSGDVTISPGERISVVVEETVTEDGVKLYEYSENAAYATEKAESLGEPVYSVAIVNPGESFLYETDEETGEGTWIDYRDDDDRESVSDKYVLDNFSIKAYVILDSTPAPEPEQETPRRRRSSGGSTASTASYGVSEAGGSNGSVKFSADKAAEGEKVTVTANPDEGYRDKNITVTDSKGNDIPVTKTGDGTYTFTMPASAVTVTPVFEEIPKTENTDLPKTPAVQSVSERFSDVNPDDWYADAVQWAVENGIMVGVSNNEFDPDGEVTRAMVVTMLWRLAGEPESAASTQFEDVLTGAWYADAVAWAAENGVVLGVTDTCFAPDEPVTREQLSAILYRYAQSKGPGFTGMWAFPLDFSDASEVSDYAYEPLCWMTMQNIISGMGDGTIAPKEKATRAQSAKIFMLFAEELEAGR